MGSRLKVLKALAGTDWGSTPEDMLLTYKSLAASIPDFAAPIYSPNLKRTHLKKIQTMQNKCLRVVTGCHAAASMEHLHHETQTLPVDDHLQLLSWQFLSTSLQPSNPSFDVVSKPQGPRQIRHTLSSRHLPAVEPFLRGGVLSPDRRLDTIKDLHTSAVAVAVRKLGARPNRLNTHTPGSASFRLFSSSSLENNALPASFHLLPSTELLPCSCRPRLPLHVPGLFLSRTYALPSLRVPVLSYNPVCNRSLV